MEFCDRGAHSFHEGIHSIDLHKCDACDHRDRCAEMCPADALVICGKEYSVDELMKELIRDKRFYRDDGGATFSGGEAMLQTCFLRDCLQRCKDENIHTCVDSAANVPWETISMIADYTDLFLIDLKAMDPEKHKQYTGVDNVRILENISRLNHIKKPVWIRIPLAEGCNTDEAQLRAYAEFLMKLPSVQQVDLFPVLNHAADKYRALNMQPILFNEDIDKKQCVSDAMKTMEEVSHGLLNLRSLF